MKYFFFILLFTLFSCEHNSDIQKDISRSSDDSCATITNQTPPIPTPKYFRKYDSTKIDWLTHLEYREFSPFENITTYRFYGYFKDSIFKGMVSFIDSNAIDTLSHFTTLNSYYNQNNDMPCIGSLETYHTKNGVDSYYVVLFADSTVCKHWKEKIAISGTKYWIDSNGFFHKEELHPDLFPCKAGIKIFDKLIPTE